MNSQEAFTMLFITQNNNYSATGDELLEILKSSSVREIFTFIKRYRNNLTPIETYNIPQFSNIEDVYSVLRVVRGSSESLTYTKLGYYLCEKNAKDEARRKYGENHYKLTMQLGLAYDVKKGLRLTPLGDAVAQLKDTNEKQETVGKLALRIPLIQQMLLCASGNECDGYEMLRKYLSEVTVKRRSSSAKQLIRYLSYASDMETLHIIDNIIWRQR